MHSLPADQVSQLMESSEAFRSLASQHADIDRKVEELSSRKFPSPEEQSEEHRLKVMKLQLKDQMEQLISEQLTPASA